MGWRPALYVCAFAALGCGLSVLHEAPRLYSPCSNLAVNDDSNSTNYKSHAAAEDPHHHQARPATKLLVPTVPHPSVTTKPASSPTPFRTREYYSPARTDRAGSSILDMITALAYGFANNATYRGACYRQHMAVDASQRQADKLALIRSIGLQDVLVYACPPPSRMRLVVPRSRYHNNRHSLLTPAFFDWLRSVSRPTTRATVRSSAVVHVRRGDVDPCGKWMDRYLPSVYYLDVVQRHVPTGVPVTVYSESASFEPFSEFENSNTTSTTVRLDTDVAEVWHAVMAASQVVLSKSSFAYVPALLNANNATVVYPSQWPSVVALPHWRRADVDIQERSTRRTKHLAEHRCRNYTSVLSGRSSFHATRR
jgi:hypothetical protein